MITHTFLICTICKYKQRDLQMLSKGAIRVWSDRIGIYPYRPDRKHAV